MIKKKKNHLKWKPHKIIIQLEIELEIYSLS